MFQKKNLFNFYRKRPQNCLFFNSHPLSPIIRHKSKLSTLSAFDKWQSILNASKILWFSRFYVCELDFISFLFWLFYVHLFKSIFYYQYIGTLSNSGLILFFPLYILFSYFFYLSEYSVIKDKKGFPLNFATIHPIFAFLIFFFSIPTFLLLLLFYFILFFHLFNRIYF